MANIIRAILATSMLLATMALLILAIGEYSDSGELSAASGLPLATDPTSTADLPAPTNTPYQTTRSGLPVVILATETPMPTYAPKATAVPVPTCPSPDQNDRDRICSIPTVQPTPRSENVAPTPRPQPTCGITPVDACLMRARDGG